MAEPILKVEGLKTYFPVGGGLFGKKQTVKAVNDVTFEVMEHETFGLVGESGCGKSTLGRTLVKIYQPTGGKVEFMGKDVASLKGADLLDFRRNMQMIFQDPYASLNPRMTVGEIIREPMDIHNIGTPKEREEKVAHLLETVGLKPDHVRRYPHEFSGGQRQRIGIARALAVQPKLIIADEPVSALDVSIQAQVLNLMNQLKREFQLTYIFVAHDLSVVEHISDRVGVMYLGNFVEVGNKENLYSTPLHPYTQALLSAVPIPDPTAERHRIILEGNIPSPLKPPAGCKFHTRCPKCMECCTTTPPPRYQVSEDHYVYCHLYADQKTR